MRARMSRDISLIAALVTAVVVANGIFVALGRSGPLFGQDFADMYVDKFEACGQFITAPNANAWFATALRGWPALEGSVTPHHIGCLLSTMLPSSRSPLVFVLLHDIAAITGAYVFARRLACLDPTRAVVAATVFGATILYATENEFVTQVTLLPAVLVTATNLAKGPRRGWWAAAAFALYLFLYPPYTLPLMPLYHAGFALFWWRSDRARPRDLAVGFGIFWAGFVLLTWPSLAGFLGAWSTSNRALWQLAPVPGGTNLASDLFETAKTLFLNRPVLYPTLAGFVLLTLSHPDRRQAIRIAAGTSIGVGAVAGVATITQSQLFARVMEQAPGISRLSFIYSRLYFFVPFVILVGCCLLLENWRYSEARSSRHLAIATAAAIAVAVVQKPTQTGLMVLTAAGLGILVVLAVHTLLRGATVRPWVLAIVPVALVLPFKVAQQVVGTYGDPRAPAALLHEDPFDYPPGEYRVLTIAAECFSPYLYPAQVSVGGRATLDGISVFYSREIAAQWRDVVKSGPDDCPNPFDSWNNRADVSIANWTGKEQSLLAWARLNGVRYVRSANPLAAPGLREVEQGEIVEKSLVRRAKHLLHLGGGSVSIPRQAYLYEMERPLSTVLLADRHAIAALETADWQEAARALEDSPAIDPVRPHPSDIHFRTSAGADDFILVGDNANDGWHLDVDGKSADHRLREAPMGVLGIQPAPGSHAYRLHFGDHTPLKFWSGYLLAIGWLGTASLALRRRSRAASTEPGAPATTGSAPNVDA